MRDFTRAFQQNCFKKRWSIRIDPRRLSSAFEKTAKEYNARADAAKQKRDQELTERQRCRAMHRRREGPIF
jgi:hypothetical protein